MEFKDYIKILRNSWILVATLALVGVALMAGYSISQRPTYTTVAQVVVSTQFSDTIEDLAQGSTFTQSEVKTYASVATTPLVLKPVIKKLGLSYTPAQLATMITAAAPLDTSLIQISVTNDNAVRAANIANAVSESLASAVQQIEAPNADGSTNAVKLTPVQAAPVSRVPSSPKVPVNVAIGLLAGLAIGMVLAVLRATLDTRVRTENDIAAVTAVAIIGGIAFDRKAAERPLIVQSDPRSPRAESFRSLRTNLQFLDVGGSAKSFVLTSSIDREGKTTTVANLAIALTDAGRRVIVIDADLRRPRLAEYLGLEGAVGLTDLLIGRAEPGDAIQNWGNGGLHVLPAGKIPPNPSELLSSPAMQRLLAMLSEEYDVILLDTPPLLPVTDAAILARQTDRTILVVASGRVNKHQLSGAIDTLENINVAVAGVVMTMLPTSGPGAYGYARYHYGYGYGYASAEQPRSDEATA